MQPTGRTNKSALTRVLALVALLCAGALQVQEAGHGHWHEQGDSYSQCLVCKSSGNAVLPSATPPLVANGAEHFDAPCRVSFLPVGATSLFDARGPPHYS